MTVAFYTGAINTGLAHVSTSVGDRLIVTVHGLHNTALGASTITVPSGFTLIGRVDQQITTSTFWIACAHYEKIAASGDLSPNTITVTLGAGWVTPTTTTICSASGTFGVTGVTMSSRDHATDAVYTPSAPTPSRYAFGVIGHFVESTNMGSPLTTANGWTTASFGTVNGSHIFTLADQDPPMTPPVLGSASIGGGLGAARASISYALKAVPDGGFRIGSLGFGPRSSGF